MSRPRNIQNKDRWYLPKSHQYYNLGYCFKRYNKVHTCIKGVYRNATHLNWNLELKSVALQLLEQRIYEYFSGTKNLNVMTVRQLIDKYSDIHFPNMSNANKKKHFAAFKHFLNKDMKLNIELLREHINKQINNSELHQNSISDYLGIINRVFNFAVNENYVDRNPLLKAMTPKKLKPKYYQITDEIINKILEYFKNNQRMYLLIRLIRLTGMRIQEAINLKITDIIPNRLIQIHGKGNRDRQFTLKPFEELNKLVAEITEMNRNKHFKDNSVFGYVNPVTPQQKLRKALKKLKLYKDGMLFHSIRKLRENEMMYQLKIDSKIVAQMLGHTQQIQDKYYNELLQADKQAELIMNSVK